MKRKLFYQDNLDGDSDKPKRQRLVYSIAEANLVSSDVGGGMHSPVLDIDFPCRLVPSSTPGHFHLYLDGLVMPWQRYVKFMNMLARFGVLERNYVGVSVKRRRSCVRLPHIKKKNLSLPPDWDEMVALAQSQREDTDWREEFILTPEYDPPLDDSDTWQGVADDFEPEEEEWWGSKLFKRIINRNVYGERDD